MKKSRGGQRIFSVESSEFFLENNAQSETNLHNLKVGEVKVNRILSLVLSIGFGVYYLFMLVLYKKVVAIQKLINTLGIPLPTAKQSIWFLVATAVILIVPNSKKWGNMGMCICTFFFMDFDCSLQYRRETICLEKIKLSRTVKIAK